ncbi:DUF6719 family protein [Bradyrhizobium sp.]|uniref:DUF6719 family protein n=1 Tax=Bradyrhizobium sp. TaxID=376 RepID=UPI00351ED15E
MRRSAVKAVPSGLRHVLQRPVGLTVLVVTLVISQPSSAQKIHSYEPLMMDPYSTIYVNDGSCSAGKVLKVQGAPKNHRRKKSCVPLSDVTGGIPSRLPK